MTNDDLIHMAVKAGVPECTVNSKLWWLKKFAALIAEAERNKYSKFFELNATNLFWGNQVSEAIRKQGENL